MKQTRSIPENHLPLLQIFLDGYETIRQKMDPPCLRPLLEIAPIAFGKWYYTALAPETILSPANLLALELEDPAAPHTEYAYTLRLDSAPTASPYTPMLLSYSTENHPLVEDLRTLISYCTPDRATDEHGMLQKEEQPELLAQLSLQADFYLEYLTRLAWLHGLLIPMPAIHTRRVQPSPDCALFFAQSTKEILFQLAETACSLASERFIQSMEMDADIAAPDFFFSLLESHTEVDRIFIDLYRKIDIELEDIWKTPPERLSAEERSIVSSFLFTGIMLDKWFLTPMSLFFHFIRPISFVPLSFYTFVNHLAALVLMEHNLGAELFTPCTYYSLTALGQELFADPEIKKVDRQKMPRSLPYEQLLEAVLQEAALQRQEQMFFMEVVPDVLSLKVSRTNQPEYWKIIQVGQDMDLHLLCLDLCNAFYLEEQADYLLSVPDQNGFPLEYSATGSKRSINKTGHRELQELSLTTGSRLLLYPTPNRSHSLSLEVLEMGKGDPYLIYPRITKQSQAFVEQEKIDEIF